MAGAPSAVLLFLLLKRRILSILAGGLTIVTVATQLPVYIRESNQIGADDVRVRVLTANLYLGQADGKSLVSAASGADVLALQELTPPEVQRLSAAGLDKEFPYRALDARNLASGVGLYSRFPITDPKRIYDYELAMVTAHVKIQGLATNPTILVAHLAGPWPQPIDTWNGDLSRMPATLRQLAMSAGPGCAIAAGDFNSTPDMRPFRNLLREGYRDAAGQAGAGFTATYPADTWVPPLISIDHMLTYQCTATTADTLELPGSDHRGLIATIEIPRSSPSS